MNKVKEFVKNHKTEITAGVLVTVCSGVMYYVGKQHGLEGYLKREIELPDGGTACPGFTIKGPLTVGDLGKLGEEFLKHDADLTKDTVVLEVGKMAFE